MTTPTEGLLETLIAFPTVSRDSNLALIDWCESLLQDCGARTQRVYNADRSKANLYATLGPQDKAGVMLSGHTDVVPVDGQDWQHPAFQLTDDGTHLYGRGTCDMKGFIACALNAARSAAKTELKTPLHFALSYDEEVGCIGVRRLIDVMAAAPQRPRLCIVGEPTSMNIA
ncbi:MAG: M20/M25/M40 family metallo-hydrolase, partial [Pseudomonadota bacterium]